MESQMKVEEEEKIKNHHISVFSLVAGAQTAVL